MDENCTVLREMPILDAEVDELNVRLLGLVGDARKMAREALQLGLRESADECNRDADDIESILKLSQS